MSKIMKLIGNAKPVEPLHKFTEFTPLEYLQIDLANNYGLDKLDFYDRIDWSIDNESEILNMLDRIEFGHSSFMLEQAEEPALFFAGALALRDARQSVPSGYPISLDAASSGLQILSILSGCRQSASICGVVPTGHRADAYTHCYKKMCVKVGDGEKIARSDLKRAIMTSLYSSTAVPKEVFGEGALLEAFYETISEEAPGAWQLNKQLQELWNPEALVHSWILPDNFHVHVEVIATAKTTVHFENAPYQVLYKLNQTMEESRSISPNIVHSIDGFIVREMHRRCSFDPETLDCVLDLMLVQKRGGALGDSTGTSLDKELLTLLVREQASGVLSARILGCLNRNNAGHLNQRQWRKLSQMVGSLPTLPFQVLSVHDCFRCLPRYGNDLRRQYLQVLADMAQGDLLQDIASQITGFQVTITGRQDLSKEILSSDYALC